MPGPPKTPTAVLKARDSWLAKDRKNEPVADPRPPKMPGWLDGKAKTIWKNLTAQLEYMGVLRRIDEYALARYCRLYSRWRDSEKLIDDHGPMMQTSDKDGNQVWRANPSVRIAAGLASELLKLERQFGMTPAARAGLSVESPEQAKDDHDPRKYINIGASG